MLGEEEKKSRRQARVGHTCSHKELINLLHALSMSSAVSSSKQCVAETIR